MKTIFATGLRSISCTSFKFLIFISFLACFQSQAQTTVNSLSALLPYLDDNNANVKLAPGTYNVTVGNYNDYLSDVPFDGSTLKSLLLFSGNNSTYDFTGVTINVATGIFQDVGNFEFIEVHTIGNNNVLKNLTLVDVGSKDDHPRGGTVNLVMDGKSNRIEGFHVTSTGSKPYGYGDSFGKGGTNNVIAHKKHSTFLVRGEYNHALNCRLIHRTYGHCIFMQAASYPTIEGCYIEGELRSTDEMLAEEGTGSAADNVDFRTTWGYRLPAGFMMSTGEEGIRAYNGGRTIIDGVVYGPMAANNVTVKNCTIKYMRGGVTIAHASGSRYVEGCTAIGCEQGFSVGGGGTIVDCYADAAYGPVFKSTYNSDRNTSIDITIIPPENGYYNGSKQVAYIGGSGHDVVLKTTDPNINEDLKILMGGDNYSVRVQDTSGSQTDHYATNVTMENYTGYTIELPNDSSGNDVTTCGQVIDNGTNNDISSTNDCEEVDNPVIGGDFTPDPNKTYYLDVPQHNVRLAANGSSEAPYTTSTSTTGNDVEWQFVQTGDKWYLRRAAGGTRPGLRTDNSASADMQETTSTGGWTKYVISNGASSGTYFLTLPDGPSSYRRLQIDSGLNINMVEDTRDGSWESFRVTEASSTSSGTTPQAGKTYYIDNPHWDARLAANGGATPYLKDPNANYGNLVSWRLTAAPTAGYYYIDGVGGEDTPRLSTDLTENAAVRSSSFGGSWTQWKLTPMGDGTFTLTTLVAGDFCRLQVTDTGEIKMVSAAYSGDWTHFTFTESRSAKSLADLDSNFATVYPNPIATSTTIEGAADTTLTIYNMNGSLLHSQSISSESETIDLSGLASGIYYAEIKGTTKIDIVKLIKK